MQIGIAEVILTCKPILMKNELFISIVLIFTFNLSWAQRHEIGVQLGASNIVGDIGKTSYINVLPGNMSNYSREGIPFFGSIHYKMNFNPYQGVRAYAGYSHIQFNDAYAKENYRIQRNYYGTNSAYELGLLFEYNFFPINNEQKNPMLSPYIFGGVSTIMFSNTDGPKGSNPNMVNNFSYTIPFGVGLKYKFNYNWILSAEGMFRPTFTDDLDYSKTYFMTGNMNSKDWLNSFSLGLSYAFGRPPCYCD